MRGITLNEEGKEIEKAKDESDEVDELAFQDGIYVVKGFTKELNN